MARSGRRYRGHHPPRIMNPHFTRCGCGLLTGPGVTGPGAWTRRHGCAPARRADPEGHPDTGGLVRPDSPRTTRTVSVEMSADRHNRRVGSPFVRVMRRVEGMGRLDPLAD